MNESTGRKGLKWKYNIIINDVKTVNSQIINAFQLKIK